MVVTGCKLTIKSDAARNAGARTSRWGTGAKWSERARRCGADGASRACERRKLAEWDEKRRHASRAWPAKRSVSLKRAVHKRTSAGPTAERDLGSQDHLRPHPMADEAKKRVRLSRTPLRERTASNRSRPRIQVRKMPLRAPATRGLGSTSTAVSRSPRPLALWRGQEAPLRRGQDALGRRGLATGGSLRRTPLYDLHQRHGAKTGPFAGFDMPLSYAKHGHAAEHKACRTAAALFDVSHMVQWTCVSPLLRGRLTCAG